MKLQWFRVVPGPTLKAEFGKRCCDDRFRARGLYHQVFPDLNVQGMMRIFPMLNLKKHQEVVFPSCGKNQSRNDKLKLQLIQSFFESTLHMETCHKHRSELKFWSLEFLKPR